ncbi:MAG: outer membrane beta-barrel protein [Nitrospira sp.]|nr:outer membrane beta-barrel protein [Nitrospira sp.]
MIPLWIDKYAEIRTVVWVAALAGLVYGAMQPASVCAETKIVPFAAMMGRYDSNIFNIPAQLLAPGTQLDDFETSIGGGARVLYDTRNVEASVDAGGNFSAYVHNTNANFFQMRLNGSIGLDRWVDQYVRGASLRVVESLRYSPDPPAFMGGVRNILQGDDTFLQGGVQVFRSNQIINTTKIEGKYPLSRDLALEGGYWFGLRHYGRIQREEGLATTTALFNTLTHTWFGGPRYQLTRTDSVAALYRQTFLTQSRSTGGRTFSTSLISLAGDYTKEFQEWHLKVQGGLTFAEPVGRTFPSGSVQVSTKPERDTVVMLTLSREGRPLSFLQGGAMISHVARVGISHRVYERLTANGTVAYAYNELFPSTADATIKTFVASSRLSYKVTRIMTADITYLFMNVDVDRPELQYQVSRHQVGLMLSIALDPLGVELWD